MFEDTIKCRIPVLHFDATNLKTECYLSLVRFKSDIMVSLDTVKKN